MDDQNPPPSGPSSCTFHKFFSHNFEGFRSCTEPYDDEYVVQMKNYKAFIFKSVMFSFQTKSLSGGLRYLIEKRIDELFPDFKTPDHPPYAAMIEAAITFLNENGGSTAKAISQFIQNKYTDLPWAHDVFLKYHLERLCEERVVAKAGDRFHMLLSDVVTEKSPGSSSMLDELVVNHGLNLSPISHVSSWDTGAIGSSSTSFDCFPIPKRKRRYSLRQTSVRKSGRIHLDRAAKVCGNVGKKVIVRKETKLNADMQVLDGEIKEKDKQTDRKKEYECSSQGQKSRRKRGRKRKSTTSEKIGKEIELNAEILLLEGEIKELEEQTVQKSAKKWRRKSKRTTEATAILLDCPVRKKSRVCKKSTEGKKAQVNSDILMIEGEAKKSDEHSDGREGQHVVVECHDPVTGTKRTVIDINLDELQDMVNEETRDLLERSIQKDNNGADALEKPKKAQSNSKIVEGESEEKKRRFRLRMKDLSDDERRSQAQEMKASLAEEMMLENKEANEEMIQGNECEIFGCNQAEDYKMNVKALVEQHDLVMEGESQIMGGVARCDEEQPEHETFTNGKLVPFETPTIEVSQVQKNPKGQQNAEEDHQAKKLSVSNKKQQEVDEAAMQNENQRIQQKHLLEEEPVAAVKISPVGHDPEKSIYNEAGCLPTESSSSVFEEEKDNLSKKNMEWQNDCFLVQPSEQVEEVEEMSEKIIKLKRNSPAEEGNEDIGSKLKQENPQVLSLPCSSKLESQQLSPQPQVLQPSQESEEKPQRHQFWNWIRKSLRFH